MKLGQVMSFLDVGLVPEEFREQFQAKLAELRDAAPKVSFKDMKKVLEQEYDEPLEEVFETFDPVPVAAASIGQVYKARLEDCRDVAVKVQYPGVNVAVRSDMQNLGMILRLMKRVAPGLDVKATAEEIRGRIGDELEHNGFVRIWRGLDPEGGESCTALGEPATLILLGDDYDGGHKAWVRWPDGSDDIVPGSRVSQP